MTIPAAVFWILAIWALLSRSALYVYLPWLCLPFGALAVVDPSMSFGSTILPLTVASAIFVAKTAKQRDSRRIMWRCATDVKGLGLFTLFTLYAVISAYICPRIFANRIWVLPMRMVVQDKAVPLGPTTANFTQAAYTLLSLLFALAMVGYFRSGDFKARRQTLIKAMLCGASVLIVTGVIDWLGAKASLDILRNGTYAIVGYTTLGDVGRITGAFPEASAFGATTATLACILYFSYATLGDGMLKRWFAPGIVALLFFLAAAAASSTAYAGILVTIAWISLSVIMGSSAYGGIRDNYLAMGAAGVAILGVCALLVFWPNVFDMPIHLIDQAVFKKVHTESYAQRNFWTSMGYKAFWDSWGIGIGTGGDRVSSWPAAIASNLGIIGIVTMTGQLLISYLRRPSAGDPIARQFHWAAKSGLSVALAMGYLAATIIDPGLYISMAFAWILANSDWQSEQSGTSNRRASRFISKGHNTSSTLPQTR
ncbi:MAG: hypothetical protein P4L57_09810 [Rhizomicrobium sp.]|nr:hypothetical protein [Rhizomicrobium sp.]